MLSREMGTTTAKRNAYSFTARLGRAWCDTGWLSIRGDILAPVVAAIVSLGLLKRQETVPMDEWFALYGAFAGIGTYVALNLAELAWNFVVAGHKNYIDVLESAPTAPVGESVDYLERSGLKDAFQQLATSDNPTEDNTRRPRELIAAGLIEAHDVAYQDNGRDCNIVKYRVTPLGAEVYRHIQRG